MQLDLSFNYNGSSQTDFYSKVSIKKIKWQFNRIGKQIVFKHLLYLKKGGKVMRLLVNRIEGKLAVCEKSDKSMVDIELAKLPGNVQEGDVLIEKDGNYTFDLTQTEKRKKHVQGLLDDLRSK